MERKKVAVLLPWLKMGGTNKIAVNFIKDLMEYCDITLVLSENSGELLPELPEGIDVIIDQMKDFKTIVKEDVRHFRILNLCRDIKYYWKIKIGKDGVDNYKYIVDRTPEITATEFDCAISYHGQSPERLLNLIYRTHTKKRVAWIHGEVSFDERKRSELRKYYDQMDHFFFVSNPTMDSFQKSIGFDRKKGSVYYNPIDKADIIKRSNLPLEQLFNADVINLLTVGRISSEKGQDMIPEIVRNLLNAGKKVCWYVIGDGDNRNLVERKIKEYNVKDQVKLLGTKTNPYNYMKACDIYVQPSYTEGYSTTICEAGMLGKAIIGTTPSGGIKDQITDGVDGMIVDATVDDLTHGLLKLIENPALCKQFATRIAEKNFEGKGEIKKFIDYLYKE